MSEAEDDIDIATRYGLTTREVEVLQLLVQGCSNVAIAKTLAISRGTTKVHVANILQKLGVPNRTAAAALVASQGDL